MTPPTTRARTVVIFDAELQLTPGMQIGTKQGWRTIQRVESSVLHLAPAPGLPDTIDTPPAARIKEAS